MKTVLSFGKPIGRGAFCLLYLLSMLLYGGALYFIQDKNVLYSIIQIVLIIISLLMLVYIITGRLVDLGRKKSQIYLLLIPIYNIYFLLMLFVKKGCNSAK